MKLTGTNIILVLIIIGMSVFLVDLYQYKEEVDYQKDLAANLRVKNLRLTDDIKGYQAQLALANDVLLSNKDRIRELGKENQEKDKLYNNLLKNRINEIDEKKFTDSIRTSVYKELLYKSRSRASDNNEDAPRQ